MRIARVIICYLLILLLLFFEEIAAGDRYGSLRNELSFQEFSQKFSVNFSLRNHLDYIGYNIYKLLHNNNSYSNTSKKKIDRIFGNSIKVICSLSFDEDFDADDEERNKKNRKSRKSKSGSYISGSFFLDLSGCHFNYIYVGNYDNYDNEDDDYYVDIEEDEKETRETTGTKKYRRRKNNFGGFSLDLSGCHFSTIYNSGDEELEEDEEEDDDGEKRENEEEGEDETSGETTEEGVGDEEQNPSSDGILSPDGVPQTVDIGINPDGTGTVTGIDALTQGGILIDPNQFPAVAQNTLPYSDPTMMQTGLYSINTDMTGMSDYNAMSQTMPQNYGGSSYVNSGTMMYGNGMYNGVYNGGNAYNNGGMYNNGMSDYSQNMGMNTSYYQGFNGTNGLGMSDNSMINGMNEYNAMSDFQNTGQNPGMYQQQGSMYQNFQPGAEYNSGMSDQTMINPNYGGMGSSMGADGNMMQMQQYSQDLHDMDGMQNMQMQSNMYTNNSTMQDLSQDTSTPFSSQDELSQRYSTGKINISSNRAVRAQDYPMEQEQETMNADGMREFSGRESENSAITEIDDTRRDTEVMQRSQYPDNTQPSSTTFSGEQSSIDGIQREVAPSDIVSRSGESSVNYGDYDGQFSTSVAQMQASPTASENSVSSQQELFQTNSGGFSTSFGRQGGNGAIYGNAVSSYIPDTDTETFSAPSTSRRTIFDGSMWSTQPIPSFEWNTTPQEETYDLSGPLRSWEF